MSEEISNTITIDVSEDMDTTSLRISQFTDSFNTVKFSINKDFTDYTLVILTFTDGKSCIFEADGENLIREYDEESGTTTLNWALGREVTSSNGLVIYQIAAYKQTDGEITSVWYSKEGRIFVSDSIDTSDYSTELIGSHPNLITRLIIELENMQTVTNAALDTKVDKEEGKALSSNDYTDEEKTKLASLNNVASEEYVDSAAQDSKSYTDTRVASLVNSAPEMLDTLKELSDALGNDPDFYNTMLAQFAKKVSVEEYESYKNTIDALIKASCVKNIGYINSANDLNKIDYCFSGVYEFICADSWENDSTYGYMADQRVIMIVENNQYYQSGPVYQYLFGGGHIVIRQLDADWGTYEVNEAAEARDYYDIITDSIWHDISIIDTQINELRHEIYPTPETEIPETLSPNTQYNFSEVTYLSLTFPTVANDGDVIYITFSSGETATTLTIDTTNTCDIEVIPEVNTGYEIFAKYNGSIWIVSYSDYTVRG